MACASEKPKGLKMYFRRLKLLQNLLFKVDVIKLDVEFQLSFYDLVSKITELKEFVEETGFKKIGA